MFSLKMVHVYRNVLVEADLMRVLIKSVHLAGKWTEYVDIKNYGMDNSKTRAEGYIMPHPPFKKKVEQQPWCLMENNQR